MEYRFRPQGVCSQEMIINIENGKLIDLKVIGGCNGNLQGIAKLVEGMPVEEIIKRLKGIKCGFRESSCPDQLAVALEEYIKTNK